MHFLTDACFMVFVPTKFVVDSGKPIYVANNDDTMPCIMVALVRKTFMISISPWRILSRLDEILSRLGDLSTRMDTFVFSARLPYIPQGWFFLVKSGYIYIVMTR